MLLHLLKALNKQFLFAMNKLIQPIFLLMNRLTYRGKFMLISSVFAIPLALFAVQLAVNAHQQLEQAQHTRSGFNYLRQSTELIEDLETIRDMTVVISRKSDSFLVSRLDSVKKRAYGRIMDLSQKLNSKVSSKYLLSLKDKFEKDGFIRGSEAGRVDKIYEEAHIMVGQAYSWRRQVSYLYASSGQSDILSFVNLLNESEEYTYALGLVRMFGSLYLGQAFVESHGADAMEAAYQNLSKLIDDVDVKEQAYADIFRDNPSIDLLGVKSALVQAKGLLSQHLIESFSPKGDPQEFYAKLSDLYHLVYAHNKLILSVTDRVLANNHQESIARLSLFYISVAFFSLVLLYLSVGLYKSVSSAIGELTGAAGRVAIGNYDQSIEISTHDELLTVAQAMEHMRLSIKEREERLELMSQIDGLTQLYNRPFFDQAMDISLANSRRNMTPLTLVMMDIDHFKKVNDTYGHQAGDECLKLIARLMKKQYQRQTDIVARYGGEEFIAILYGQTQEEALLQTEKLRRAIEDANMTYQGKTIPMTASFGLASMAPPEWQKGESLVGFADSALYQAKESGRNRICIGGQSGGHETQNTA